MNESQLSISYKSQKKSLPQEERQLTTSSIPYIKPDDSKTPIVDRSISPSNIEGLTDNRDHKVNTLKLQVSLNIEGLADNYDHKVNTLKLQVTLKINYFIYLSSIKRVTY